MSTDWTTLPTLGVRMDTPKAEAEHRLGTVVFGPDNTIWVYVQANGTVATGTCTVDGSFQLTDAAGNHTADVAFADNEYGWVRQTAVAAG